VTEPSAEIKAQSRAPSWPIGAAAIVAIATGYWLIFSRAFLNYDTLYALVWGRDLAHGRLPDYDGSLAPTPHPLAEAVGAIASLFGTDAGYTIMLALAMLAFGALLFAVFELGRECFSWPVGLVAATVIAISVPFLSYGMRAYVDIPFVALIVFAALIEVRRPRAGVPVLVLLALAGLLRPEAWFISAAYWLYMYRSLDHKGRASMAALALSAPFIWALSDLVITGSAVHSLTATRDTSETLGRPRGILKVPEILPRRLGEIVRWVPLIGGAIGFALAMVYARRRAAVPAVLAVLGGLGFVFIGIAGLSLLGRYLFMPAAMVTIFFGVACFGWLVEPRDSKRRRNWMIGGIALTLVFVSSSVSHQSPRLEDMRDGIQYRGAVEQDLEDLAEGGPGRTVLKSCTTVYVPNHRPVPILAWYVDRPPGDFVSAALVAPQAGAWVIPATQKVRDKFVLDPRDPRRIDVPLAPPAGWRQVTRNASWQLYERGC
jgi:hypothetical protein